MSDGANHESDTNVVSIHGLQASSMCAQDVLGLSLGVQPLTPRNTHTTRHPPTT
jgi:hypothetical protein